MAERIAHSPKIAALLAYDAGVLKPEGRRRVEAHLAGCDACREALASMRVYDALVRDVRAEPVPEPDWSRMELALRREARDASRRASRRAGPAVWIGIAAAAAAGLGFFLLRPGGPTTVVEAPTFGVEGPVERAAPEPDREPVTGEVTAVVEDVQGGAGVLEALEVGAEVHEGMRLVTGAQAFAQVRFFDGTGAVLRPDTSVRVEELRVGRVVLELEHGTVANEVASLGEGDRYVVRAGEYEACVRGTRFAVTHTEVGTAVTVDEGVVEVFGDGEILETIRAPGTWRSSGGVEPVPEGEVPAPLALSEASGGWPVLRLPAVDWVRGWEVAGVELPPGTLAMRVPPGDVDVAARGDGGRSWRSRIRVGDEGHFVEADAIRPGAPPVRTGYLAPELIAPVVRRGQRGLARCQEQVDRETGRTVIGRFTLRVTIGRTGEVQHAQLLSSAEPPPRDFRQCVLSEVRNWTFPAPTGGIVTFEQPLNLGTRRTF